jgi:hypothetical protein
MNAKTLSRFLRVSSPAVFLGLLLAGASPSPSAQAAGVRDLDRDGIHNISDADVDNDGIPNGSDPNVDGGLCISGPLAGKYIGDRLPNDRTPSIPGLPVGRF